MEKVPVQPPCLGLGCASEDDCRTSALPRCTRAPPAKPNPMWMSNDHVYILYPDWHVYVPLSVHSRTEPCHHIFHCNKHTPDSTLLLCLSRGASGGIEPTPSPKRLVFKSVIKKPTSSTSLPSLRLRGSSSSTSLLSARCHLIQVCYPLGQEEEEDPRQQFWVWRVVSTFRERVNYSVVKRPSSSIGPGTCCCLGDKLPRSTGDRRGRKLPWNSRTSSSPTSKRMLGHQ